MGCYCGNFYSAIKCQKRVKQFGDRCRSCLTYISWMQLYEREDGRWTTQSSETVRSATRSEVVQAEKTEALPLWKLIEALDPEPLLPLTINAANIGWGMSAKNEAWRTHSYSADTIEYGFEKDKSYNDNDEDNSYIEFANGYDSNYNNKDTNIGFGYDLFPDEELERRPYRRKTGRGGGSCKLPRLQFDERNGGCNLRRQQPKPYEGHKYPLGPSPINRKTNKPNITGLARAAGFYLIPDGRSGGYGGRQDQTIMCSNASNNINHPINNNLPYYGGGGSDIGWTHTTCGGYCNNNSYYNSMRFLSRCYEHDYMTPTVPFNNCGSGLRPRSVNVNAGWGNVDGVVFRGMNNSQTHSEPGNGVGCCNL
ncbi:hypothetical protein F4803DRAFT_568910 [Xylaria telfairii]|nr:hypothetical protein F4803DRAFT_568910 [Xylaria telfairii]